MYHFTYRIDHPNGKFYVGRHSTEKLEDDYKGSGSWPNSIKDKSILKKTVLEFYDTFDELKEAEKALINKYIDEPFNMNFNDAPVGFGTGDRNPAKKSEERIKRSERTKRLWKTQEYRNKLSNRKYSEEGLKHLKELNAERTKTGNHNFQRKDVRNKIIQKGVKHFLTQNPMWEEKHQERARQVSLKELQNGTHNFIQPDLRERLAKMASERLSGPNNPMKDPKIAIKLRKPKPTSECPHCHLILANHLAHRYHFENCKSLNKSTRQRY